MTAGLLTLAEERRLACLGGIDSQTQARLGQHFTPITAATMIGSIPRMPSSGRFRILDPGAGTGQLSAAVLARIFDEHSDLEVEVVGIEMDQDVAAYLSHTYEDCAELARVSGVKLETHVITGDFVALGTSTLDRLPCLAEPFDLVVMNPPYFKLGSTSLARRELAKIGVECPNMYAAFLALGAEALGKGGQMVAITPRSFANGPYFAEFRKFLLERMALDHIHVFESRSTIFSETGVLQENIVFSATRDGARVEVTINVGDDERSQAEARRVPYANVVHPEDSHQFIRIIGDEADITVVEAMARMPCTLTDTGLSVSTGRVVDFRARECLRQRPAADTQPLVYPGNLRNGVVDWPRDIKKPQAFHCPDPGTEKRLLPYGDYVLVKRFSAKEERRRVVAAVWHESDERKMLAVENHLNVFHRQNGGFDNELAIGLSYWLNSTLVDKFFRTFSGHTQVNATDLRTLRFPTRQAMAKLGKAHPAELPSQNEIDALVAEFFIEGNG